MGTAGTNAKFAIDLTKLTELIELIKLIELIELIELTKIPETSFSGKLVIVLSRSAKA